MSRTVRSFYDGPFGDCGEEIFLESTESYHLSRVLRHSIGDHIQVINGKGRTAHAECISITSKQVILKILSIEEYRKETPHVRMVLSMTKGGKWEDLIKPLTELGAERITPLFTARTEVRQNISGYKRKAEKWEKLAIEACKQSGNPWLPQIDQPLSLEDYLINSAKQPFVASLNENSRSIMIDKHLNSLDILIGPEGGWTDEEEQSLEKSGAQFFSLGKYTLRAETSAVCALAVARSQFLN